MAAAQFPTEPEIDASLDRLEAALETIALGMRAAPPPGPSADLEAIEDRVDAAIAVARAALGHISDQ